MRSAACLAVLLAGCTVMERVPRATDTRQRVHTPPPPSGDLANLAPIWELRDDPGGVWGLADADETTVVLDRPTEQGDELLLLDPATGRVTGRVRGWSGGFIGRPYFDVRARLVAPGRLLVVRSVQEIALLDRGGRELWRAGIDIGYTHSMPDRAVGGALLLAHPTQGFSRLDLDTGRERWKLPLNISMRPISDDSRIYVIGVERALHALDLGDGRERWQVALPEQPYSFWDVTPLGGRVVLASSTALVLDAATGVELARHQGEPERNGTPLLAAGGRLIRAPWDAGVRAEDPLTGARLWSFSHHLGDLVAGADAVYGCSIGGVLHALDLADGGSRWSWGLPACSSPWPIQRRHYRVAGERVFVRGPHGIVAFARASEPAPRERVTISGTARVDGRARAGLRVQVGDSVAVTDRRGRYQASFAATGVVLIALPDSEVARFARRPCPSSDETRIELTGTGTYRADLGGVSFDYECDRACHCD